MVRVQAEWGSHGVALGRSSLVQPGGLAQAAVGLVSSRSVDVSTLEMTDYTQRLYRLDHAILAVGGFAHGIGANGSWFPLVVAVPTVPPTESSP
jgi:hypothetical protein